MMKYKSKILLIILLISSFAAFGGAQLIYFTATSKDGNVILEWKALSETNLDYYLVERANSSGNFIPLARVEPRADKTYEFIDQTAFKSADAVYTYQLKIVDKDGSVSYSSKVSVAHSVSSVKRTWGSIKALFR
ncbi:hypothetical protein [Rosettibacter firmus]|uniref:hypothetical protein n=1 Tax=Rosettibacter firmus TaxID=3111522 RepID=UPI00336BF4EE